MAFRRFPPIVLGVSLVIRSLLQWKGVALSKIAKRVWEEIRDDDVLGRSAQLAYYFFLALFPFLIFLVSSLSVIGSADRGRALIFQFFAQALPSPAFQLIHQTFEQIIRTSGPLRMSVGIVGCIWSTSMGMGAVMDTLNAAYKLNETRPLLRQYRVAIQLTISLALMLMVGIVTVIAGNQLAERTTPGWFGATVCAIGEILLVLVMCLLGFGLVYYWAPNFENRRWHWITPGAVAGVILLFCFSFGPRAYIRAGDAYNKTYGALGAVIILMLTFYLSFAGGNRPCGQGERPANVKGVGRSKGRGTPERRTLHWGWDVARGVALHFRFGYLSAAGSQSG